MPALSIATSVPVPMAMPTSAAASAGASLTPSPAIATILPGLLQLRHHRALLIGQHFGLDVGDAELPRDGVGRGPVVAGQHDDLDAFGRQRLQRIRRRRLDRIGDGEQPRQLAVDGDVDHGGAVAAQALALVVQRLRIDAERLQEVRVAEHDASCRRPCRWRPCRSASRSPRLCRVRACARWLRARWRRPADARWRVRRWPPAAEFGLVKSRRPARSR